MFDFLLEANLFPFLFGQIFEGLCHHCLELFVRLFTLLIIRLQCVVVREVVRVFIPEVLEVFRDSILCPK